MSPGLFCFRRKEELGEAATRLIFNERASIIPHCCEPYTLLQLVLFFVFFKNLVQEALVETLTTAERIFLKFRQVENFHTSSECKKVL